MRKTSIEIKAIFIGIAVLFGLFLLWPIATLITRSFVVDGGFGWQLYMDNIVNAGFIRALTNSVWISALSALITCVIAFYLSYTVHFTGLPAWFKRLIGGVTIAPMFLPTITYGFVIIYAFGNQGLITKILGGTRIMDIYGPCGLVAGYVIYTIPIAFLLLNNTFKYVDKNMVVVSRVMGDSRVRRFFATAVRPMVGTLGAVFIQSFTLSFTDFGIPASIGGQFDVVAIRLYNVMLGSVPDIGGGSTIAMMMLLPSVASIILITFLEKYNFRYNRISRSGLSRSRLRDAVCAGGSSLFAVVIVMTFAVMFVVPFVKGWPYDMTFSMDKFMDILTSRNLPETYVNTIIVAACTAFFGSILAFGAALISARAKVTRKYKIVINSIAMITNTVPGMVLGLAYLLAFGGTSLQNTFLILIICNIVHYFTTPYLMGKSSLEKMNKTWEQTASLMGDSWFKTLRRIIIPNSMETIIEMFCYYFINSMITISALIFLVGARTGMMTTRITSLQHLAKFDEIFVLSLLILATNILVRMMPGLWRKFTH